MWRTSILASILVLLTGLAASSVQAEDATAVTQLIDRHIDARLAAEKLTRAAPADDATFLRRVFLDLHGVIPSAERTVEFLDNQDPKKRAALIEELLASPRFGEHFADVWRGRLISPLANDQRVQSQRFADWMANRFNRNDGWDQIASDLLTASGKMEENPAVTYLIEGRHPLSVTDLADLSSRYFLGVRLNCAQCHDHPFVDWKQSDYWGMAAFFAQIQTPNRPKIVYLQGVQDDPKMSLASLKDADTIEGLQVMSPTFLGGTSFAAERQTTHRAALAEWITSEQNPYFAKAMVNRMWWHFFGRGIVNPVDDMHAGNVPSHPELLDELSQRFAASGFDLKLLCQAIVSSRTYQQTSRPNDQPAEGAELFARMSIKVLTPEQSYDSLVAILGARASKGGGNRNDARAEFSQFFAAGGDPDPLRYERGIPHLLRLMNSPQFAGPNVAALVARTQSNVRTKEAIVEQLFVTILSRRPNDEERQLVDAQFEDPQASPPSVYRELAWALLMSSEFSLNR